MAKIKELRQSFLTAYDTCPSRAFLDVEAIEAEEDGLSAEHQQFGTVFHKMAENIVQEIAKGQHPHKIDPWALFLKLARSYKFTAKSYFTADTQTAIREWYDRLFCDIEHTVLKTEWEFHLELTAPGSGNKIPVKGTIDRVGRLFKKDGAFRITDYKTNRAPYSRDFIEETVQGRMYAAAVFESFPDAGDEIEFMYDMMRFGHFTTIITRQQVAEFLDWLDVMWQTIQNDKDHLPRLNTYCSWCNHKLNCPAFTDMMKSSNRSGLQLAVVNPQSEREWQALWAQVQHIKSSVKAMEDHKDRLEAIFRAHLADVGPVKLSDKEEIFLQTNPRYKFDPSKLYNAMRASDILFMMPEVVTVSKEKLDKLASNHPKLAEIAEAVVETEYVKPTLKSRKPTKEEEAK